jgi:hypothetical protein
MGSYLLIGAGLSRNWGGPLSEEITGSLLGELHDDAEIARALRSGPFEEVFQGFQVTSQGGSATTKLLRFQGAIVGLFARLNKTFLNKNFEFSNDLEWSVKRFLAKFDAIFSLNQDLLLEIHYMQTFISQGKWNGLTIPGMVAASPAGHSGPVDFQCGRGDQIKALSVDRDFSRSTNCMASNWFTEAGEPMLIMGNAKTGAIQRFPVLRDYHQQFEARLSEGNARLMVIGYSFQDDHINSVIERASRERGLGTYLVDLRGREVLLDPKMARAAIVPKRDIEDIKLIGELRRPLTAVFGGDTFAHGELMRFFP